jgi:iron complex transport system substrate-binding protein
MTSVRDATGTIVALDEPPRRIVSLVPSVSETLHNLGLEERVVGVTTFCVWPPDSFPSATRLRGTKNPHVEEVIALRPDVVFANLEENRERDVTALRTAGLRVHVSYPRTVAEAAQTVCDIAALSGEPEAGETIATQIETARERALADRTETPLAVLCPIWMRPWMAIGEGCYSADLLQTCGMTTRPRTGERYPRFEPHVVRPDVGAVLLPSEPYPFTEEHVALFDGWDVPVRLVDGALLTWHGPRTSEAIGYFAPLARRLRAC